MGDQTQEILLREVKYWKSIADEKQELLDLILGMTLVADDMTCTEIKNVIMKHATMKREKPSN